MWFTYTNLILIFVFVEYADNNIAYAVESDPPEHPIIIFEFSGMFFEINGIINIQILKALIILIFSTKKNYFFTIFCHSIVNIY